VRIQQQFMSICFYHFFFHVPYAYTVALEKLGLHSLCNRRDHLDALIFIQVYCGLKPFTSALENVSLCVPPSNLREFSLFPTYPSNKDCPAWCAYAANMVGKNLNISALGAISLDYIYTPNCGYNYLLLLLSSSSLLI
jgi:hypothetical protein